MIDLGDPRASELMFQMMAQQMSQAPPEIREGISRVKVHIKREERSLQVRVGRSDNPQVEGIIQNSLENWGNLLARAFQAIGYEVILYE